MMNISVSKKNNALHVYADNILVCVLGFDTAEEDQSPLLAFYSEVDAWDYETIENLERDSASINFVLEDDLVMESLQKPSTAEEAADMKSEMIKLAKLGLSSKHIALLVYGREDTPYVRKAAAIKAHVTMGTYS